MSKKAKTKLTVKDIAKLVEPIVSAIAEAAEVAAKTRNKTERTEACITVIDDARATRDGKTFTHGEHTAKLDTSTNASVAHRLIREAAKPASRSINSDNTSVAWIRRYDSGKRAMGSHTRIA